MGGFGLVIPTGAKNADGAWAFEKWWATKASNGVEFAKISGWIPANRSSANDSFFTDDPRYAGFVKTLDYAEVRPDVAGYSDVEGKALTPALEKFMSGQLSAQQALSQAAKQGDRILEENRK
ncbi:extracellular solute-binding protein [Curtobacterium flaccumfaciens]|nr:extracellular solute-binding protein [Curtobacterium flaccumfaciens]